MFKNLGHVQNFGTKIEKLRRRFRDNNLKNAIKLPKNHFYYPKKQYEIILRDDDRLWNVYRCKQNTDNYSIQTDDIEVN